MKRNSSSSNCEQSDKRTCPFFLHFLWLSFQTSSRLGVSKINPRWRALINNVRAMKLQLNRLTICSFLILRFISQKEQKFQSIIRRSVVNFFFQFFVANDITSILAFMLNIFLIIFGRSLFIMSFLKPSWFFG